MNIGDNMKKKNILNLIKYHTENNDEYFRNEAYEIAKYFDKTGDVELSEYILALLSDVNTFVPQIEKSDLVFFKKISASKEPFPLPENIKDDIVGLIHAVKHNVGVNKFLFEGAPGTGKTETVRQLSRILERDIFSVDFSMVVDSKLGQTAKNIAELFYEIKKMPHPEKVIILFDEIDAIALDRMNDNDIREMGRATSTILKELDQLNDNILFIATTNLFSSFDKALIRRFDSIINFNNYSREDLLDVAEYILNEMLLKFKSAGRNIKLFKKIINLMDPIPYPGDLRNLIKTSIAFSDPDCELDYLKILYKKINKDKKLQLKDLQKLGFTVREIEIITGISKSQVSREWRD